MVNIGFIGMGYWGPNLLRNFSGLEDVRIIGISDRDQKKLDKIKRDYPQISRTTDYKQLLKDKRIKAVVIATPSPTHYDLVKESLLFGKHVFCEKPLTLKSEQAFELVRFSEERKRILMVGHLLEYHPAVKKLKEYIDEGMLGKIRYFYSLRVNLGKVRQAENALWNLGPHDISVILYLAGEEPETVSAMGECYLQEKIEDVVFLTLYFKNKKMAHIHLSWLDPHKIRRLTIIGSKKMAVFDDMESVEKLKIYEKGIFPKKRRDFYDEEYLTIRTGDILIPKIEMEEPLRIECRHFIDCIRKKKRPLSDAWDGLRVVEILEAAQESLKNQGRLIRLGK